VLLVGSDADAATATAVRLAEWLERQSRSSILRVEASFGVAQRTRELDTPDLLLGAADEAMYRAKHERKLTVTATG
jgi:PleD family two-component response regulator